MRVARTLRSLKFVVRAYYCLTERNWLMTESERSAIAGVLRLVRPKMILEFGTGWGGATCQFDRSADKVVTVDCENRCPHVISALRNTVFLHMTTRDAAARLRAECWHFDLALVDAEHSEDGVYDDVLDAIALSDLVLCHDSIEPQVRSGIERAVTTRDVYVDLDFVPGGRYPNGLWAGLALIVPRLRRGAPAAGFLASLYDARAGIPKTRRRVAMAGKLLV